MNQEQIDLSQSWVDRLKELGFSDLVLFNNGRDIWACRGPVRVNVDLIRGGSAQVTVAIEMYKFGPTCEVVLRDTFDGALNDLIETLEELEASIPKAKEEIAKLLAEVKE